MSLFDRILRFFSGRPTSAGTPTGGPLPPVRYAMMAGSESAPPNSSIKPDAVYVVAPKGRAKWALFQCPCNCGEVVTLSLQRQHRPHWSVSRTRSNRATLYPSIWRDQGCFSHFWLRDGRVNWCDDTGQRPFEY